MISAIILCYNQKRFIKEQFRAILKQDYPGEWEIIISDDFSQDGSFAVSYTHLTLPTKLEV